MSLLEKAKAIVKEQKKQTTKKKRVLEMDQLLQDPEVKKTARYLVKHMSQKQALDKLNEILESEGRLPKMKNGRIRKITYPRFRELLPKPRKKRAQNA